MEVQVPEVFMKPLLVPNKTLMGPGPSNATRRVLDSMSNPLLGECHPECIQVCLQNIASKSIADKTIYQMLFIFQERNLLNCSTYNASGQLRLISYFITMFPVFLDYG